MRKKITAEQEQIVLAAFRAGANRTIAGQQAGLTTTSASKILRRFGIASANISIETEKLVIEHCLSGLSGKQVASLMGISPSSISNITKRNNVPMKRGRQPYREVDHEAFDEITPESAYWMGFIFADGCIKYSTNSSPTLAVGLAAKDRNHLVKLRTFLKSTHAISNITHAPRIIGKNNTLTGITRSALFSVRSRRLTDALRARGFVIKGPRRVPTNDLENSIDFWRGCVDGDGTVRFTEDRKGHVYPSISLCGHFPLLKKFQRFAFNHGIKRGKGNDALHINKASTCIFMCGVIGRNAIRLIDLLYSNAVVALDRKHAVAQQLLIKYKNKE